MKHTTKIALWNAAPHTSGRLAGNTDSHASSNKAKKSPRKTAHKLVALSLAMLISTGLAVPVWAASDAVTTKVVSSLEFASQPASSVYMTPGFIRLQDANGITSRSGNLFLRNANDEYTITIDATLLKDYYSTAGTSGGYGVFFDTELSADNKDTGYVLQLDRGGSGLRIFQRANGVENYSTYKSYGHANDPIIPATNTDPWWLAPHELTLKVSRVADVAGQKLLEIWIDGQKLNIDYKFTSTLAPEHNLTGLRTWNTDTVFKSMKISVPQTDITAPEVTAAADRQAVNNWYNQDVVVSFAATDVGGSGIATIDAPVTVSTEGQDQAITGYATDKAGNVGSASLRISLDKTAPQVSGNVVEAANADGWYNGDVTVHFTASDALSGLAEVPRDVVISGEGEALSASATVSDGAGNTATAVVSGIKIDRSAPVIELGSGQASVSGVNGSLPVFTVNENASLDWSAADFGPAGLATDEHGSLLLDTRSSGTQTSVIEAADRAGNKTALSYTYKVVYGFSGILQPINPDNTSIFKLGSTIPVKFRLTDAAGAYVNQAVANLAVKKLSSSVDGSVLETEVQLTASTGTAFRYDPTGNQYIYNLSTRGWTSGTYRLVITLNDGQSYSVNIGSK